MAYIYKIKAKVITNLCATAKIVVKGAWTQTAAGGFTADYAASGTLDKTIADTSLNANPRHNLDVPGWTACTIHFACNSANSTKCAGTATTAIKYVKKYATVAAGATIKIDAFINGNDFYADNSTKASVTGVGNVKYVIYPKCDLITAMTPSLTTKTLKVEAGKTGTFPLTYTSTGPANSDWPASGICGEATAISGTSAAWATYASGVTTVKVPTGTKAGNYKITLTGSYGASGGGTDTSKST